MHWSGATWSDVSGAAWGPAGVPVYPSILTGCAGTVFASDGGQIRQWNGSVFVPVSDAMDPHLQIASIWCGGANDVWIAGALPPGSQHNCGNYFEPNCPSTGRLSHWDGHSASVQSVNRWYTAMWGAGVDQTVWLLGRDSINTPPAVDRVR
jgi:hypothetical protein